MAVVLAEILRLEHVVLALAATTRDEALREIVATMQLADAPGFLGAVIAREEVHSTLLGHAVAFPHARTELLEKIVLGIGRSAEGVPFASDERAQLIFVIGVPKRMVTDYLVCVGALARLVNDGETRAALLEATTAEELVEILRDGSLVLE